MLLDNVALTCKRENNTEGPFPRDEDLKKVQTLLRTSTKETLSGFYCIIMEY